jgi:hypothetical protein
MAKGKQPPKTATTIEIKETGEIRLEEPIDAEMLGLQVIISALQALDAATRTRVLEYVNQRFSA